MEYKINWQIELKVGLKMNKYNKNRLNFSMLVLWAFDIRIFYIYKHKSYDLQNIVVHILLSSQWEA